MKPASALSLILASWLAASAQAEDVTYTQHVAPVLWKHCAECHRPGEIGPFPLLTYQDAAKRADFIASIAQSRRMPPWKPDPDYSHFQGERRLTETEIATLTRWAEAGAPEGDPRHLPPLPSFPEGDWKLGTPDLVLEMQADFTVPADGPDVFRCFVIPIPSGNDLYVSAVEFRPGNPRAVHHITGFLDGKGRARRKQCPDGLPGYPAENSFPGFKPSGSLGTWAPGAAVRFLPEGVARYVRKGSDLVLTIHYHPTGKEEVDRSRIGLHLAKKPPRQITGGYSVESQDIAIPAGASRHRLAVASTPLPVDVNVVAVWPHMHRIGREMKAWAELPDGSSVPLVWVKDWDMNWQGEYRFETPPRLPKGTVVQTRAYYDNSADNPENPHNPPRPVSFGLETNDEMCICHLQVVTDRLEDLGALAATPEGEIGITFDGSYGFLPQCQAVAPPKAIGRVVRRIAVLTGILLGLCALAWWAGRRRPTAPTGSRTPKLYQPPVEHAPRDPRYPALDVWRGLACLFIVVSHLAIFFFYYQRNYIAGDDTFQHLLFEIARRMWCGVPILFVISGYCIAASCDAGRDRPGPVRTFFARRVRRVCLPYWIFLIFIIPIVWYIGRSGLPYDEGIRQATPTEALTYAGWLRNFTLTDQFGCAVHRHFSWLPQTWTLAYEVQFYIVCGLLLAWPKRFFTGVAVVSGLTLVLAVLYHTVPAFNIGAWFFDGHWLVFAAGIGLYYQLNYATPLQSRLMCAGWLLMGLASLWWRLSAVGRLAELRNAHFIAEEFVAAAAFTLLAVATRRWDRAISENWFARPLAFVGRMGYSVYLVHWQITVLVMNLLTQAGIQGVAGNLFIILPIGISLSLLAGWIFYELVEKRFMNAAVVPEKAKPPALTLMRSEPVAAPLAA